MMMTTIDSEQLALLNGDHSYREFHAKSAARATEAARSILAKGQGFGDRKAYISDVAAALGVPMSIFASMIVHWNAAGLIEICRADLVMEMDEARLTASEIQKGEYGARSHFVVVD